ncbi:helix-turn-helix domain-containing protein [Streptomyces sp. NPDC052051]|uniref:TetR/AcrR family transcriptional regulator n=1 Tax=Streptomyces sp. NPDC052051 TaxID=3154649 RepID=UPI00344661FD
MVKNVGLRELKKHRLRQTLEREALALFAEQGYEATTVEQIAARSEISTTTFYRYYSSKEDLVLSGALGYQGLDFASPPPPGESLADSVRTLVAGLRAGGTADPEERAGLLARFQLIASVPELRALHQQRTQESIQQLAQLFSRDARPSLRTRVAAALVGGAVAEALYYWVEQDGEPDLIGLVAEALEMITPAIE